MTPAADNFNSTQQTQGTNARGRSAPANLNPQQPQIVTLKPQRRSRKPLLALISIGLLAGSYTGLTLGAPLPALNAEITAKSQIKAAETPMQELVNAHTLPTAAGWLEEEIEWSNSTEKHPIASITKLITALVGLDAQKGTNLEAANFYTFTAADTALTEEIAAADGMVVPMPEGVSVSAKQMLQLILVPSANNYAVAYARNVFGSDAAFVQAAQKWLQANDLKNTVITEASGQDTANRATLEDILRLTRLALKNPTVAEIVTQTQAEVPGIGVFRNTNPLIFEPHGLGVKTGSLGEGFYNLTAARKDKAAVDNRVALAVTLLRPDEAARATATRELLTALDNSKQVFSAITAQQQVGTVTLWTGEKIALVADKTLTAELYPGQTANIKTSVNSLQAVNAGAAVGSITLNAPQHSTSARLITAAEITAPSSWWRLTHPQETISWWFHEN